jgi:uncharacterized membrane protein YbhN (UPF0104 family)
MSPGWWAAILAAAVVNQVSFIWPYQAVLPHLRFWHGFLETQSSTAVSNTVPAGGAVAIGLTFRMFGSFGFSDVAISTAVATTGIWNLAFKFGLPIVAVVLVAVTGQSTGGAVGVALLGVLVIGVSGLVLWLVFRSTASARWIGQLGDQILNWVLHFFPQAEVGPGRAGRAAFPRPDQRHGAPAGLAADRHGAGEPAGGVHPGLLLRAGGRHPGEPGQLPGGAAVLRRRPAGRGHPGHPGRPGTVDAAFIGMLTAFGATSNDALAADIMWRATTYFPPIFIGIVTYLIWKRGLAKGTYANDPDVTLSAVPADG